MDKRLEVICHIVDDLLVLLVALFMVYNFLENSAAVLVTAEELEFRGDSFGEELALSLVVFVQLNQLLDDVVCILVLDKLDYGVVLKLYQQKVFLIRLSLLKGNLDHPAAILVFSELDHVSMDLIYDHSPVEHGAVYE